MILYSAESCYRTFLLFGFYILHIILNIGRGLILILLTDVSDNGRNDYTRTDNIEDYYYYYYYKVREKYIVLLESYVHTPTGRQLSEVNHYIVKCIIIICRIYTIIYYNTRANSFSVVFLFVCVCV